MEWEVYSTLHSFLVVSKSCLDWILAEPEVGCQRRLSKDFVIKNKPKVFLCYHLPWSFKIFINMFAFLYLKVNSMDICEGKSFPSFFRKMLMSAFLLRFKANYLEKMRGYLSFSLWKFKMAPNSGRPVTSIISTLRGGGVLHCLKQNFGNLGLPSLQGDLFSKLYSSPGAPGCHLVIQTVSGRHFSRLTYKLYGASWLRVASWRCFSGFSGNYNNN